MSFNGSTTSDSSPVAKKKGNEHAGGLAGGQQPRNRKRGRNTTGANNGRQFSEEFLRHFKETGKTRCYQANCEQLSSHSD